MPSPEIKFEFSDLSPAEAPVEALILPVFQEKGEEEKPALLWDEAMIALDTALQGDLREAVAEEKFKGERETTLVLRPARGGTIRAKRLILTGAGEASRAEPKHLLQALRSGCANALKLPEIRSVGFLLSHSGNGNLTPSSIYSASVDSLLEASYHSLEAREPATGRSLEKALLLGRKENESDRRALREAVAMARAKSFAKDLVNMPANLKTTRTMEEAALSLQGHSGIQVEVISDVEWIRTNMPAFFSVARGSLASDPPRVIKVRYRSSLTEHHRHRIAYVGKTVIFDTGGYQVKPGEYMITMKGDMTGGAQVLGAIRAASELELPDLEFTVYLAATPNKIDSDALLPDSIVDSRCGKKIEIRNTDAEGRLTLIDAVTRACEEKPEMVLTIATLTGAAKRALGENIALMANDREYLERFVSAAKSVADPLDTLDVTEEDYEDIKSKLDGADLINTNHSKTRGAQTAAAFVMSGTKPGIPHLHLDIAGVDVSKEEKATGIGQKSLIRFLIDESRR